MQEKTYITASNHLKISFLSQNFMRALGIAMMLFIPGIFTSVSIQVMGVSSKALQLITRRLSLAPSFSTSTKTMDL
jgi:hypothetical protein